MDFFRRAGVRCQRLAVFSGSFHPPTRAHLGLARAALALVDEVLFVLPRVFPHKVFDAVTFDERMSMLLAVVAAEPRFSAAASDGGLFLDIAAECRRAYGAGVELDFLCGRDAAERIVDWDYGPLPSIGEQLESYHLLVAARDGTFTAPPGCAAAVHQLPLDTCYDEISSSEVRRRVQAEEPWQTLVPENIAGHVARLYGRR